MLRTSYRIYCRIEEVFVGLCFFGVVALTFMNAMLRYFGKPIVVAEDACLLLFPWAAFIGADVALRYSRLVGMDLVLRKMPPKSQKSVQLLIFAILIAGMIILIPLGFRLALSNWNRVLNSLPISYGFVTISLPTACILMIFTSIIKMVKITANYKDDNYDFKKDNPEDINNTEAEKS